VIAVLEAQERSSLRYCDLAIQLGFMTEAQRDALLARQQHASLPLGQVLASMGLLSVDVLEQELRAYEASRSQAATPPRRTRD
jgi:riboflavin synthase